MLHTDDSPWVQQSKWTPEYLGQQLKILHGSSNITKDLRDEAIDGFIQSHVRSHRYELAELQAIIKVFPRLLLHFRALSHSAREVLGFRFETKR